MTKHFLHTVLLAACGVLFFHSAAHAAIVTKEITYRDGATELQGFYAYDDAMKAPMPGVVIVHEWWGHNEYVRERAKQLAALGYAAFAADMYGKGVLADTPAKATELSKPFYDDRTLMRGRALAALAVLKAQPEVDAMKTAAMGYCFGGSVALELLRSGADIKGAVSFHGGLATTMPAAPGSLMGRDALALNGGADKLVPQADRDAFVAEMQKAGANVKSIDYAGALHAFTNPEATEIGKKFNMPVAYDESADKQSFAEMQSFLARIFR